MSDDILHLIGCGILKKEILFLINKNKWDIETKFIDSDLHNYFEKLYEKLEYEINLCNDKKCIVFYGCCHPSIDKLLEQKKVIRTNGQNCIEMLLGKKLFNEELANGAYFLLEEWALRWNEMIPRTFGCNNEIIRLIFQESRKYLLCVRTKCSGEFKAEAEAASEIVGLPIRWIDVPLDELENFIIEAISKKLEKNHE